MSFCGGFPFRLSFALKFLFKFLSGDHKWFSFPSLKRITISMPYCPINVIKTIRMHSKFRVWWQLLCISCSISQFICHESLVHVLTFSNATIHTIIMNILSFAHMVELASLILLLFWHNFQYNCSWIYNLCKL